VNIFRFDRTNWKAVALCLVAATVFWFFNALNKEHTATISYPIEFQYDQAKFIPVKSLPSKVGLNLTGSGWDLLRKSLGFKVTPLQFSLEKPAETKKIPPATVLPLAAVQLGQIKVNHVASDTLLISIEPKSTRNIKLAINPGHLRFELGYGISGPLTISPDSVMIEGPLSLIQEFPDSLVLAFPPGRISQDVKTEVDLSAPNDALMIKPLTATVQFEVSELEDITRSVKVIILPAAPYRYQSSADSLTVKLRLPGKLKGSLTNAFGFVAVVDLRALDPGVSKVAPSIKGIPDFAQLLFVDSITIRKY
jgi:hypothetical protein